MSKGKIDTFVNYKRFREIVESDRDLLEKAKCEPSVIEDVLASHNLDLDPQILMNSMTNRDNEYNILFREYVSERRRYMHGNHPFGANTEYTRWFKRTSNRINFTCSALKKALNGSLYSVMFELSDGCTVNCPFCCLDAGKFRGYFEYNAQNADLFKKVMTITKQNIGERIKNTALYFATEPLDNPDYELFLRDYHDIVGLFPQTTTARAIKDAQRIKTFMNNRSDEELKYVLFRFSILTLAQAKQIHKLYDPYEVFAIELLYNNPESIYSYSKSGRAIHLYDRLDEVTKEKKFLYERATCVCLSGLVVNLMNKTVKLITPVVTDELFPCGYKEFETIEFSNDREYGEVWKYFTEKYFSKSLNDDTMLQLGPYIDIEKDGNYYTLIGDNVKRSFSGDNDFYRALELLSSSSLTFRQLCDSLSLNGIRKEALLQRMLKLYELGCFEEL